MKKLQKKNLTFAALFCLLAANLFSQTTLEFGPSGGPTGSGPATTSQTVTFYKNTGTSTTFDAFSPAITATFSLSNQQFGPDRGNDTLEGLHDNYGLNFGATAVYNPSGNNVMPSYLLFSPMFGSADNLYTASPSLPGQGIVRANNRGITIFPCSDALIRPVVSPPDPSYMNANHGISIYPTNSRVYYGDLTITFNVPVSNPVLHFQSLGGSTTYGYTETTGVRLGYSTEYELINAAYPMSTLSGTDLGVVGNVVKNTSLYYGSSTVPGPLVSLRKTASGSILVTGTNIKTLTFKIYLQGDGTSEIVNTSDPYNPDPLPDPSWVGLWSFVVGVGGDLMQLGVSLEVPVNVTGNVFNDPDHGNVNSSSADPIATGIYANLIDANGNVVATTTVNTGTYSFNSVFPGDYTVNISTTAGTQGNTFPSVSLPSGWYSTGEFNGPPNTGNDGNVNGTSVSFNVASTDVTNVNFGISQTPLPVTFGNIKASTSAGNLFLTWETLKEINNSHFIIQASADGERFVTIGEVATKAVDGNSSQKISYSFSKEMNSMAILGFSITVLGFGMLFFSRRRKIMLSLIIIAGLTIGLAACSKTDKAPSNNSGKLYIRIVQVDKQGTKQYSKVIEATR